MSRLQSIKRCASLPGLAPIPDMADGSHVQPPTALEELCPSEYFEADVS